MKRSLGKLIAKRTDALTNATHSLAIPHKLKREIAFQIAELSPEFEFVLALLRKAEKGQPITAKQFRDLYGMIRWHWGMHLRPLKAALLRALSHLEPESEEQSEKQRTKESVPKKRK
jgi:hypothetical protein